MPQEVMKYRAYIKSSLIGDLRVEYAAVENTDCNSEKRHEEAREKALTLEKVLKGGIDWL